MRSLTRPDPEYNYQAAAQINRLRAHRDRVVPNRADSRQIPEPSDGHVVIGSWNIANLGVHDRRPRDLRVIAELLSWYEIVAIQEVADNLADFIGVMEELPDHFDYVFSDRAGNDERAAYIDDTRRVSLGPKIAELVIVDSDRRYIRLPGIDRQFHGFNRNPYLVSFGIEDQYLLLANCHLLYGPSGSAAERARSLEKRQLEAYAVARWCDLRRNDQDRFTLNIIALGDFNLPHAEPGDEIYRALTRRGLTIPPHETRIPTNVSDTHDYDQVTVVPHLADNIVDMGVFDFDEVIFPNIWDPQRPGYWRTCAKYYISDHRPIWVQLELPND